MSEKVGERLPDEVVGAFDGSDLDHKVGPAHLLVTTDPDGTPRPCMLSAGEILAPDDRRFRLALWPGTRTGKNLARGGAVVLCYIVPGTVLYVRGTSRRLGGPIRRGMEGFEVEVDEVAADAHPGLPVTEGLLFGVEGMSRDRLLERWQAQIASLREA